MLLLVSVALTAGVLLATQRYGVRALLPLTGLQAPALQLAPGWRFVLR